MELADKLKIDIPDVHPPYITHKPDRQLNTMSLPLKPKEAEKGKKKK